MMCLVIVFCSNKQSQYFNILESQDLLWRGEKKLPTNSLKISKVSGKQIATDNSLTSHYVVQIYF